MIEVTMDQSGRIEIPEAIRKGLGLNAGSKLEIALDWLEGIRLRPLPENDNKAGPGGEAEVAELIWKNGVLMVKAVPVDEATQYAIDHAVELDREARMKKLMEGILP